MKMSDVDVITEQKHKFFLSRHGIMSWKN